MIDRYTRPVLPDSTIFLDYVLDLTAFVIEGLTVYPERMARIWIVATVSCTRSACG